jgi:hypothetical protein
MGYIVKQSDLIGDVAEFPIEIVQIIVNRGLEQEPRLDSVLRRMQTSIVATFAWYQTIEGELFWRRVIAERLWDVFYKRYPELFGDKIRYAIVKEWYRGLPECIWRYVGNDHGLAGKCKDGDIYFVENVDGKMKVGFAIKDSPRYRRVIANGIKIE